MRSRLGFFIGSLFAIGMLLSCSGEDDPLITPGPDLSSNIEADFKPYVDSFISEMQQRGLDLSQKGLDVVFVNKISAPNSSQFCAYGYTNFNGTGKARVEVIDTNSCWFNWTATQQENLIYHELGHALLGKPHDDFLFPNGSPRTLMCSSETCNNYRIYNKHQSERKTYYLDKLAFSATPMPVWASAKSFSDLLFENNFDGALGTWFNTVENIGSNPSPFTFFVSDSQYFSPPRSLAISSVAHSNEDAFAVWYKDFEISDFNSCANLIVRADIITQNLNEGVAAVIVDLYDDSSDNFDRFFKLIDGPNTGLAFYENLETDVICLPLETTIIRVRLYLQTQEATAIYMDNLEVSLYE